MFVKSRMEKDVTYRRKGSVWVIKAQTVTFIDENKVTPQELKQLYGDRIDIISRESFEEMEKAIPVHKEIKREEKPVKIEPVKKPLDDEMIDDILMEIKNEVPIKPTVQEVVVTTIPPETVEIPVENGGEAITGKAEINVVVPDAVNEVKLEIPFLPKDDEGEATGGEITKPEEKGMGLDELDGIRDIAPKKPEVKDETPKKPVKKETTKKATGKGRGRKKKATK